MDLHRLEADARRNQRQNDNQDQPKAPERFTPEPARPVLNEVDSVVLAEAQSSKSPAIEFVDHTREPARVEPKFDDTRDSTAVFASRLNVPSSAPPPFSQEVRAQLGPDPASETARTTQPAQPETESEGASATDAAPSSTSILAKLTKAISESVQRSARRRKDQVEKTKQDAADSENKTASTTKKNPTKYVVAVVVLAIGLAAMGKHMLSSVEDAADQIEDAAKREKQQAIDQATALLGQATAPAAVRTPAAAVPGDETGSPATSHAPPATEVVKGGEFSPPPPPSADNADPYLAKLAMLKDGLGNGMGNTKPSKLPSEIAKVEVPLSRSQVQSSTGSFVRQPVAPPLPEIPDDVEGGAGAGAVARPDPLARVSVYSSIQVRAGGNVPYLVGPIRANEQMAYIYPRNGDPTLSGQWMQPGDQTDEGWTVVKVRAGAVNVVSPDGRVFQIQSGS